MPGQDDTGEKGDAEKAGGGERAASLSEDDPNIQEVIQWATGVRDSGVLEDMRWSLPEHVLKENIRRFKETETEKETRKTVPE